MRARKSTSADRHFNAHLNRHAPTVYAASKSLQTILGLSGSPVPFPPPPPVPASIRAQQEFSQVQIVGNVKYEHGGSLRVQFPSLKIQGGDRYDASKEVDQTVASSRVKMFKRRRATNMTDPGTEDQTDVEDDNASQRLSRKYMRSSVSLRHNCCVSTHLNETDDETGDENMAPQLPNPTTGHAHARSSYPNSLDFPIITIAASAGKKRPYPSSPTETLMSPPPKKLRQEKNSLKTPASPHCSLTSPSSSCSYNLTSTLIGWYHALTHSQLLWRHSPPLSLPRNFLVVRVSFWSTETVPPRELMRIEPGDVEMVRWCEVDTFCEVGEGVTRPLNPLNPSMHSKNLTPGRWTFLTVKEHPHKNSYSPSLRSPAQVDVVRAWHLIAFPTSSITKTEEKLVQLVQQSPVLPNSNVEPGPAMPRCWTDYAPDVPTADPVSASASSPDAYSNSAVPAASAAPSKSPLTLCRTVLHLSKAGHVPLVENYGADTRKWAKFCDAVGKGKGRIMFWTQV